MVGNGNELHFPSEISRAFVGECPSKRVITLQQTERRDYRARCKASIIVLGLSVDGTGLGAAGMGWISSAMAAIVPADGYVRSTKRELEAPVVLPAQGC